MTDNLSKRIFTSFILSTVLLIGLFFHKYLWLILLVIAAIICFFEFNNLAKKICKKKESFIYGVNVISSLYLIFFTYSAFEIYKQGLNLTIFLLLICIFSDIGGYVIGKTVGGKKLTKISPNKTISGSIGSFIFSLTPLLLFNYDLILKNLLFCLIVSFSCQLGDLIISYFKRLNRVKDTGNILPGHGGLLDRIDGIIFVIPTIYILKNYFGIF